MSQQRLFKFYFVIQDVNLIKRSLESMHYIHENRNVSHDLNLEQFTLNV